MTPHTRPRIAAAALALTLAGAACAPPPDAEQPDGADGLNGGAWFTDVTGSSGVAFRYESGHADRHLLPESVGGGVCLLDADGDGDLDVYFVQGGSAISDDRPPNALYENLGGLRFRDVTAASGAEGRGYGMGCTVGDHDGDGLPDLLVTNLGPDVLLRNVGNGRFEDVSGRAGLLDDAWSIGAAFADVDRDGDLDLYVARYVGWSAAAERTCTAAGGRPDYCKPTTYDAPLPDRFYRNAGGGRYEDETDDSGVGLSTGHGMGVAAADFDGDGTLDIYVANDATPNFLWLGRGDGTFREEALLSGCALSGSGLAEAGMGVAVADLEPDGDRDLLVSHLRNETNTLYVNRGRGVFDDGTDASGLGGASLPFTGFGIGLHDFDEDGLLDAFIANGRVLALGERFDPGDPYAEPDLLFRGIGPGRFEALGPPAPGPARTSRGAAFGDLDGDGDLDAIVVHRDAPASVLRNDAGDARRGLLLDVRDRRGAPALGAHVVVRAGSRAWRRDVAAALSYASSVDPRVHVGLGDAEAADDVTVTWPDGTTRTLGPLAAGTHRIAPP